MTIISKEFELFLWPSLLALLMLGAAYWYETANSEECASTGVGADCLGAAPAYVPPNPVDN